MRKEESTYLAGYKIADIAGSLSSTELSDVLDPCFVGLSIDYARQYQSSPKNFLNCFIKFPSIRTACAFITMTYKRSGAFKECQETGKDFTDYARRQPVGEKWFRVLAEILLIIFCIINL